MKIAFVTGGTGFIGNRLISSLIQQGIKVKALIRKKTYLGNLEQFEVQKVFGDLTDRSSFIDSLNGVDIIYHLGAVVTDWAPRDLYEKVNIQGTKNIFESARIHNIKRVIYLSTIDVLRTNKRLTVLTEDLPYSTARLPYIKTKVEAEKIANFFRQHEDLEVTIFRPAWVFGPGDTTLIPEIAYQLKREKMLFIGNLKNFIPLIYIDNLIDAILCASFSKKAANHIFNVANEEKITWKELTDQIADGIGAQRSSICFPYTVAYLTASALECISKLLKRQKRPLLTKTAVKMMGESLLVDISKIKLILNYEPRINLTTGIHETIEWLGGIAVQNIRKK